MKKYITVVLLAFVVASGVGAVALVHASTIATMPQLFNQNGFQVNSSGYLVAGYYYMGGGPSAGGHQIEYYGNGTYYDPSIRMYGGSITNQYGTAGVSLGYVAFAPNEESDIVLMPALYSQTGIQVNTGAFYVAAGYYNLSGGQQVYYYGNGTYYNPATRTYGGSVLNSSGKAGVTVGYSA